MIPVSYTHLDVYKRQLLDPPMRFSFLRGKRLPVASSALRHMAFFRYADTQEPHIRIWKSFYAPSSSSLRLMERPSSVNSAGKR